MTKCDELHLVPQILGFSSDIDLAWVIFMIVLSPWWKCLFLVMLKTDGSRFSVTRAWSRTQQWWWCMEDACTLSSAIWWLNEKYTFIYDVEWQMGGDVGMLWILDFCRVLGWILYMGQNRQQLHTLYWHRFLWRGVFDDSWVLMVRGFGDVWFVRVSGQPVIQEIYTD